MSVGFDHARAVAHEAGSGRAMPVERRPLATASGRTLAVAVTSGCAVPGFDTAAMDGWVVRGDGPWRLGTSIPIGGSPDVGVLPPGTARPIATGAAVPPGPVGVLRAEHGRATGTLLAPLQAAPVVGTDIRLSGEEWADGDTVLPAGTVLAPPALAVAAICGTDQVVVRRPPQVDVLLVGDELVGRGVPAPGRVRDAHGPQLPGLLALLGAAAAAPEVLPDDPDRIADVLDAAEGDLTITTGGTARGPADHLRAVLDRLGYRILLDGVGIRPGSPTVLASRPDGRPVLCLPGPPHAALVALVALGGPLLAGLLGRPPAALGEAVAGVDLPGPGTHRTALVAARFEGARLVPTGWQGPAMLRGLVAAQALAVVPADGVRTGRALGVLGLPWTHLL